MANRYLHGIACFFFFFFFFAFYLHGIANDLTFLIYDVYVTCILLMLSGSVAGTILFGNTLLLTSD